jgi:hypothetical protein
MHVHVTSLTLQSVLPSDRIETNIEVLIESPIFLSSASAIYFCKFLATVSIKVSLPNVKAFCLIQYYPRADLSPIHFFITLSILSRAILSTPQKLKLGRINIQDKTTFYSLCSEALSVIDLMSEL